MSSLPAVPDLVQADGMSPGGNPSAVLRTGPSTALRTGIDQLMHSVEQAFWRVP
jgi:hypothetical protein